MRTIDCGQMLSPFNPQKRILGRSQSDSCLLLANYSCIHQKNYTYYLRCRKKKKNQMSNNVSRSLKLKRLFSERSSSPPPSLRSNSLFWFWPSEIDLALTTDWNFKASIPPPPPQPWKLLNLFLSCTQR